MYGSLYFINGIETNNNTVINNLISINKNKLSTWIPIYTPYFFLPYYILTLEHSYVKIGLV